MSCLNPYPSYDKRHNLQCFVPCRDCLLCRESRCMELYFYSACETQSRYQLGQDVTFTTLTYNDVSVPISPITGEITLRRQDLKNFQKLFNYYYHKDYPNVDSRSPIMYKYMQVGEYGDETERSHYHICFYGLNTAQVLKYGYLAWKDRGLIDAEPLRDGGCSYLTSYISSLPPRDDMRLMFDDSCVERPFLNHSSKLGNFVLDKYVNEALENNMEHSFFGRSMPLPNYLRKQLDPRGYYLNRHKWIKEHMAELARLHMSEEQYVNMKEHLAISRARKKGTPVRVRSDPYMSVPMKPGIPAALLAEQSSLDEIPF